MLNSIRKIHGLPAPRELVLSSDSHLFKTGEIFRGAVLKRFPSGEVLIEAKGREFTAKTDLKLEPGAGYRFQAVKTGQRTELRVLEGMPHDLRPVQELWSACRKDGQRIGELLKSLSGFQSKPGIPAELSKRLSDMNLLVPMLTYHGGEETKASWFSKFLLVSGLFWESKLARFLSDNRRVPRRNLLSKDLKGCLLALKQNQASEKAGEAAGLKEKIDQVLGFLEQEQCLNLTLSRIGLGWCWFIPGTDDGDFKGAEILLEQKREEGTRFCLMADFSRLGQVLVEFFLCESNLDVNFLVEDEKIEKFITGYFGELRKGLKKIGFSPGTISSRTGEEIDNHMMRLLEERVFEKAVHLVI